ncbi:MAG: DNA-3-methyladenine glycosylase [Bacteroidales bacterium]
MKLDNHSILPRSFYTRPDVVNIARELLGKVLYTCINGQVSAGIITETEAYAGITDKASHAYNNRRTQRTEIMYHTGGTAYVYLCYGIHSLFNIVTSVADQPHAVLIRGINPLQGVETMKLRSGKTKINVQDGIGPGKVARLLGIAVRHSGLDMCDETLAGDRIWVQDEGVTVQEDEIVTGPRIGIDYAGEDALLPYRFRITKK